VTPLDQSPKNFPEVDLCTARLRIQGVQPVEYQ
jgi:hypothetical protein